MRNVLLCICIISVFLLAVLAQRNQDTLIGDRRGSAPNVAIAPKFTASFQENTESATAQEAVDTPYGLVRRVDVGQRKVVALTFDFCELATKTTGYNVKLVRYLQKNSIPATFFVGGKWLRTHAARAQEFLRSDLFEIANHAWSHGNFALLDEKSMHEQIDWTQAQYAQLYEESFEKSEIPHRAPFLQYFRFPYGRSSPQALRLLQEKGVLAIQWDVVGEMRPDNSEPYAVQEVLQQVRPGSILLFHGNMVPKGTKILIPRLIKALQERGYSFVTVGKLLAMGKPEMVEDGYFITPGDNVHLDTRFGVDGTGRKDAQ